MELLERKVAKALKCCLVCDYTDNSTIIHTDTEQGTDQSTGQSTNQGTGQSTDQSTNQGTDQSIDQGTNQDTDQSTNRGTDQSTDQGTNQGTDQSTNQGTDQSTDQGTNQGADQSTNQGTEQGTNQGTDQSTNQGTDQSTDQGTGQSVDQSTGQSTDQCTNQGTDQGTNQGTDQSTDQGTSQGTDQSTDQGTEQSTGQGAISSTSLSAIKRKKLYPKIHFCGNIIWICSTCTIKERKCNYCHEDLLESQFDTEENVTHTQLFTDLTRAEKRENRVIFQNENNFCKNHTDVIAVSFCPQCECMFLCQDCSKQHCIKKSENKTKYHIVKHIGGIKECKQNRKSSPCVVHTDTNSDSFCCTHNVPICFDCKYLYHKTCRVNGFAESLEKTTGKLKELNDFIEELKSRDFRRHFQRIKNEKEVINGKLTDTFDQLRSKIEGLEKELKKSVEDQYEKQHKIIQRQIERMPVHQKLVERVLVSPPDAAFFDMTHTLTAIVSSIEKDISGLNDMHVEMKFQERRQDLEEVIKSLEAMRFVSRESSHGNVMRNKSNKKTERALYSNARSVSGPRGSINITEPGMSHETKNVVYVYTCTKCHMLYVGQTSDTIKVRDSNHFSKKEGIYGHECEQGKKQKKVHDQEKREKHFAVVSCVRKDLDDKGQRCMMETLIMLKLGTLTPDGINGELSSEVQISLEILRFQTLNGADVELSDDGRTAIIKESTGNNPFIVSREMLMLKKSYEVLLEEINNENATICLIFKNQGENTINPEWIPVPIQLPTGMLECRVGIDFYKQYGYVYVNGTRGSPIRLQENFEAKEYWAMFQACSKITGLPIQLQKTWIFTDNYAQGGLILSDYRRTAECKSEGCITSKKLMELNILYDVFVEELYEDYNGFSHLGILLQTSSTESRREVFSIQLIEGSRYGVIVDAQKNLYLLVNGERKHTKKQCVISPCYFYLWSKCFKVSTLSETTVNFN